MKQLEIALFEEPVIRAPCDTLVVPLPSDERPLRGEAGWVDWRVCGAISKQIASGYVDGARGEAVLLPAPRPLTASRILLVGLGSCARLEGRVLQRAFSIVAEKLLGLGADLALLAPPGAIDFAEDADLLVRGCIQALSSARGDACLRLGIASAAGRVQVLERALAAVASDARSRQVSLGLSWPTADLLDIRAQA